MKQVKMLPFVGLLLLSALFFTTCDLLDDAISDMSPVGIYVGAFSFEGMPETGGNRKGYTDLVYDLWSQDHGSIDVSVTDTSLAYLDLLNKEKIKNVFNNYKPGSKVGRPLVYTVDKVIQNLEAHKASLNSKVTNITIVSFSAGRDQQSPYFGGSDSLGEYGPKVKNKIKNGIVKGDKTIAIDACSVILTENLDDDIKQTASFIVSGDEGYADNPNIIGAPKLTADTLKPIFQNVAKSISSIKYVGSTTITINDPGSVVGTSSSLEGGNHNFFASFDGKAPDTSTKYLKGKVAKDIETNKWVISGISYTGITGGPSEVTESWRSGPYVDFRFANLPAPTEGFVEYRWGAANSWVKIDGADLSTSIKAVPGEQKSSIIFLVLDATLDNDGITAVKAAANDFIDQIYNESKAP
ncbi:MAG: hypothetical protein LBH43_14860 [Treponema sp.]|jgi:hypothetical protein|nr:hypothetical protein [Treponema sp.]